MIALAIVLGMVFALIACSNKTDDDSVKAPNDSTSDQQDQVYCKHDDPSQIEIVEAVAPTCQKKGLTEGMRCNLCGTMVLPQSNVTAIKCNEGDWIVDKEATKTEDGAQHTECVMCGKTMREEIIRAGVSVGLYYRVSYDNKTCAISGIGSCKDIEVVIPSVIDGYNVTSIGEYAFSNCSAITSIVMPDSITNIEANVFYGCDALTKIIFKGTVAQWNDINKSDLWNRYWVTGLKGSYTIYCTDGYISKDGEVTYYSPEGFLLKLNDDGKTYTVIGIGTCTDTDIVIASSHERFHITNIERYAFQNCTHLTSVKIGNGVTSIGAYAFSGCNNLKSVTIGNSVTNIGIATFSGCNSLERITLPFVGESAKTENDTYQYPLGYIFGTEKYDGGISTQQYYYERTTEITEWYTRYYIPVSLKSVTITGGNILYGAFYNCSGLTNIAIPYSITSIGDSAFRGCSALTSIIIPNSVTSIGVAAFYECSSLTNITIPDGAISIGGSAFNRCYALTSIEIPNSVTTVGSYAFYLCSGLTNITIPNKVTSIEKYTFGSCYNLTRVIIPYGVTSIGESAFYFCESLMSITIPNSVTSIGSSAFLRCTELSRINYEGTIEQWNAIEKVVGWNRDTGSYTIYCTDAEITKDGTVICYPDAEEKLYARDGDYIYFGEYPQTIKADDVTITSITDDRGYYLGSDGSYYAKVTANPVNSEYQFSTGDNINGGTVYYFKVEPIRWRILSTDGETAFILRDSIIANKEYNFLGGDNNYKNSRVRSWLNYTFYRIAFTELQQQIIQTTSIDNSVASTGYDSNPYVCEDTYDKIFLLSHAEVDSYNDMVHMMRTSDYSRAMGAFTYSNYGYWWLRSPAYKYSSMAQFVKIDGKANDYNSVYSSMYGVVPAMWIAL